MRIDPKIKRHNTLILNSMSDKLKGVPHTKCQVYVTDTQTNTQYIGVLSVAPIFSFKVYSFDDPKELKEENVELGYIFGNNKFDAMIPLLITGLQQRNFRLHFLKKQPFEEPGYYS